MNPDSSRIRGETKGSVPPITLASASSPDILADQVEPQTYIARLCYCMQKCLRQLDVTTDTDAEMKKMESMAVLIHASMSSSNRNYHSVQHVFDISKDLTDPIAILAALFHDCVYYNVDGGLSQLQASKLIGAVSSNCEQVQCLKTHPDSLHDPLLRIVLRIFGLKPDHLFLPTAPGGLNEYLSAVIAVRELQEFLPNRLLAQIACCIEATIPFRPTDAETPLDRLYTRMIQTNQELDLGMTEEELVQSIQRAAILSNADLGNFGSEDRAWFLDNTWSLLPESNESLRNQYLYTVKEFQHAVFKMSKFFSFLRPEVIFQQFRGVPNADELDMLLSNARRNLEIGRKYVGAKLLSISVLSAFCELTGSDAPISLFMGDLPSRRRVTQRLEDTLTELMPNPENHAHVDDDVYDLLAKGRTRETAFDIRQSPLAAYFYSIMGDQGLEEVLANFPMYPMDPGQARRLLTALPHSALTHVAANMAKIAYTRRRLIAEVMRELSSDESTLSSSDTAPSGGAT